MEDTIDLEGYGAISQRSLWRLARTGRTSPMADPHGAFVGDRR
jgi:hypothetical protein